MNLLLYECNIVEYYIFYFQAVARKIGVQPTMILPSALTVISNTMNKAKVNLALVELELDIATENVIYISDALNFVGIFLFKDFGPPPLKSVRN